MKLRTDSTEYAQATIVADHDITGKAIDVALPVTGEAPATWHVAEVTDVTQTSTTPPRWTATYRILVGPTGGVTSLTPGTYDWTVRLTDNPEVPIRKAGTVTVTLV